MTVFAVDYAYGSSPSAPTESDVLDMDKTELAAPAAKAAQNDGHATLLLATAINNTVNGKAK